MSIRNLSTFCCRVRPLHSSALVVLGTAMLWIHPSSGIATALLAGLGLYGLYRWKRTFALWHHPAGWLFLIGALLAVLSLGWSYCPRGTLRDLSKSLPLALGVWGISTMAANRKRVWQILLASALLISLMLLWDMRRILLNLEGADLLTTARHLRPYLYSHPNVSSLMAAMSTLIYGAYLFSGKTRWPARIGLVLGGAVNLAYLVIMASRGPQLVFALSCCGLAWFVGSGWKWRVALLCAFLLLGASARPILIKINPRFADATMAGFNQRDIIWAHTRDLIAERPLLGYGHGKKTFVQATYHHDQVAPPVSIHHFPHAHSYWLMLLFQGGALALLTWGTAWLALAIRLRNWLAREQAPVHTWRARWNVRMLPVLLGTLLALFLVYGLADFPDHIARTCQFLLVGLILGVTRNPTPSCPVAKR